jgi:hypothetical protein
MVLDTADYNRKIASLLEDHAYGKLMKDPTEPVKRKIVLPPKNPQFLRKWVKNLSCGLPGPRNWLGCQRSKGVGSLEAYCEHYCGSTCRLAKHLVALWGSHTGNSPHHAKNSTDFVRTLLSLSVGPQDIMVSFDAVSLFIRVPIT